MVLHIHVCARVRVCACACVCLLSCIRLLATQPTRLLCPWGFPDKNTGVAILLLFFFFFNFLSCPFWHAQKAVRIETVSTFLVKQKSSHSGVHLVRSEGASSRMTKRPEARPSHTDSKGTTFAYTSIILESESRT